jgi:hypothetical protein
LVILFSLLYCFFGKKYLIFIDFSLEYLFWRKIFSIYIKSRLDKIYTNQNQGDKVSGNLSEVSLEEIERAKRELGILGE